MENLQIIGSVVVFGSALLGLATIAPVSMSTFLVSMCLSLGFGLAVDADSPEPNDQKPTEMIIELEGE